MTNCGLLAVTIREWLTVIMVTLFITLFTAKGYADAISECREYGFGKLNALMV